MFDNFHQNVHHSSLSTYTASLWIAACTELCATVADRFNEKLLCRASSTRERWNENMWDAANWQLRNHRRVKIIMKEEETGTNGLAGNILRNCMKTTTSTTMTMTMRTEANDNELRIVDRREMEREVLCTTRYESAPSCNPDHNSLCRLSILLIYFRKDKNHEQFPSSLFSPSSSRSSLARDMLQLFSIQCRRRVLAVVSWVERTRRGSEPSWRGGRDELLVVCRGGCDGRESSMNKSLNIKISFFSFERIEIFRFYGRWLYIWWVKCVYMGVEISQVCALSKR